MTMFDYGPGTGTLLAASDWREEGGAIDGRIILRLFGEHGHIDRELVVHHEYRYNQTGEHAVESGDYFRRAHHGNDAQWIATALSMYAARAHLPMEREEVAPDA